MARGSRLARACGVVLTACAVMPALSGCGLLGSSGSGGAPGPNATTAPPRSYAITSRIAAVIINGGARKNTLTGSSPPTNPASRQPHYSHSTQPPPPPPTPSPPPHPAPPPPSHSPLSPLTRR